MTGFITSAAHESQQRLTRKQKAGEGGLDSYPFFANRYKPSDSLSVGSGSVLGRRSKEEHTENMNRMCRSTYTPRFVCVCCSASERSHGDTAQNEFGRESYANARTANHRRMFCGVLLLLLLYTRYHNGTTTVSNPTVVVPSWYHGSVV
jgi:hypothetical protein